MNNNVHYYHYYDEHIITTFLKHNLIFELNLFILHHIIFFSLTIVILNKLRRHIQLLIVSKWDYLIQVVDTNSHTE